MGHAWGEQAARSSHERVGKKQGTFASARGVADWASRDRVQPKILRGDARVAPCTIRIVCSLLLQGGASNVTPLSRFEGGMSENMAANG